MDYSSLKSEVEQKTAQTLEVLQNAFAGLRTGRASVHLLDGVKVPVYGSEMPLNQVATVSTPDTMAFQNHIPGLLRRPINVQMRALCASQQMHSAGLLVFVRFFVRLRFSVMNNP